MELGLLFKTPLYKLLEEMPYEEFHMWLAFLKLRPPEMGEDYRAAMTIAALNPKANLKKMFPSLFKQREPVQTISKDADGMMKTLQGSKMLSFMKQGVGSTAPPGFFEAQ